MNMNTLLNEGNFCCFNTSSSNQKLILNLILDNEGYSWEGDYEQTWKAIQEDVSGNLQATEDLQYRSRKRQMLEKQSHIRL